jgi:hypothetical protein
MLEEGGLVSDRTRRKQAIPQCAGVTRPRSRRPPVSALPPWLCGQRLRRLVECA